MTTTTIAEAKKRRKSTKKAAKTRKLNEKALLKKRKTTSAKRIKTIEKNEKAFNKIVSHKERAKKFNEFTSKPIVWLFALFGWGHAFYYLFELIVLVLRSLGYM